MIEFLTAFSLSFGFLIFLPLGESSAWPSRLIFSCVLAFILMWHMQITEHSFVIQIGERFLIGIVLSLPVALMVEYAGSLGELIDTGRGQMIAQIYDPVLNTTISSLAIALKWGYWCLLLTSGVLCQSVILLAGAGNALSCYSTYGFQQVLLIGISVLSVSALFSASFLAMDAGLAVVSRIGKSVPLNLFSFLVKLAVALSLFYLSSFYPFLEFSTGSFPHASCNPL